jgi:hypothetical protein
MDCPEQDLKMAIRSKSTGRRLKRLERRVEREVLIFPDKHDKSLQRLIKKSKKPSKTMKQQIDEWKEFNRRTA